MTEKESQQQQTIDQDHNKVKVTIKFEKKIAMAKTRLFWAITFRTIFTQKGGNFLRKCQSTSYEASEMRDFW